MRPDRARKAYFSEDLFWIALSNVFEKILKKFCKVIGIFVRI